MADPFATVDDVNELRPLDDEERSFVTALLPYAAAKIRRNVPAIDANITAGLLDPLIAQYVNIQMIVRVLRNRDGIRQETVGPSSITYDTTQAIGQLMITPDELTELTAPKTGLGIGSVRLGRERPARALDAERPIPRDWECDRGWGGRGWGGGYDPW